MEPVLRFIDWMAWRFRALRAPDALDADALYWDRSAAYCHERAAEARAEAARRREARLRARFNHPRGVGL